MIRERQMQTVRGPMAWLDAGAGWPVLLLHAFPLTAEMWRPQLERVPDGWRFIAPDLRGFGRTPLTALPEGRVAIDQYAADLGELMDCLELEDAVIAGLSMGGYIAFAMYRRAPARFNGLVLADTRAQADTAEGRSGRARMRELLARGGPPAVADQMLPKLLSGAAAPALTAHVRSMIETAQPSALDAAIAAMMDRPDSTVDLPRIACATLVVAGELDTITTVADANAMQRAIPRSALVVIPGAGHLSNLEQPAAFSRALGDFLLSRL
jgi:pimeloyl-ACP methyl ester carboxylesterase